MCNGNDVITNTMNDNIKSWYDKYYSSIDRFNLMIYVTFVLDSRYKIRAMSFWLRECKGDELTNRTVAKVSF